MNRLHSPRKQLAISYLAAAASCAHVFEANLPSFGPWFKPGIANTFTVVALFQLGIKAAAQVTFIRILVSSLILGTIFSPTFALSVSGSLGAIFVLLILSPWIANYIFLFRTNLEENNSNYIKVGPVSVSLLASLAHITLQLITAEWIIFGHKGIMLLLPWLLLSSWITGIVNGFVSYQILSRNIYNSSFHGAAK
ncbi:Gx transporter family protein [Candidatus Magnetaquicoccus inordinatus]|uniref:Gx transporter family protein n=1 Tax=Candidatus Magnetaquicoccus inordinatus TaxID=2496818 RepID=UPI00102C79FB|nr:Gx transporter family protein [Candidatus Magnetaquicoccus inordinatus]